MPITGQGWELHVVRERLQTRGTRTRTVGEYQVYHDGRPAAPIVIGGRTVQLSGTVAESRGMGQNQAPATEADPSRIAQGRYQLGTWAGEHYKTAGYRADDSVQPHMPAIELRAVGNRTAILIHPGKNEFLSSIGCLNPCTLLADGNENIDYPGSRRRVIALIEDMKAFLGALPAGAPSAIANAWVAIDGEPMPQAVQNPPAISAAIVDGNVIAAQNDVGVKNAGVKISQLHPKMGPAIVAVAQARLTLGLPRAVITSGNDSNHMQGSLHYRNRALDFRANNITLAKGEALEAEVTRLLGDDQYDVIFETFENASNNHLHVEYDPG